MPFIGNKPTAVPLTSADLEDNIISTAKIQDNAVTTAKTSYSDAPYRNIIINGDMSIAQRGTSSAGITSGGYYTLDRFNFGITTMGTWTMSQSTDVPSGQGFANSLKLDCTTADASPASGDLIVLNHIIEGQNVQYLKKGTANAVSLTASFWVKSTKTGTFILELQDNDNSRTINKSYTVNTSNTWEKKTITFEGDTTGTLTNDNGASLTVRFWLGAGTDFTSGTLQTTWGTQTSANRAVGQVNIADSTANDWLITGLQLEAGTTASDFEFLPYDVNLQRCYRYCYRINGNATDQQLTGGTGSAGSTSRLDTMFKFSPPMRVVPTATDASISTIPGGIAVSITGLFDDNAPNECQTVGLQISADTGSPFTTDQIYFPRVDNSTSAFIEFDAEL